MAVNSILRTDAEALIPVEVTQEIIQGAVEQSTALSQFRKLPNMTSNVKSMPILESLPMAYWVDGDNGMKGTSKVDWANKYIRAEELAVIIPIPENVIDDARDSGYDIWAEIKPLINQALGQKIDEAILFGINKPTSWRDDIVTSAEKAGKIVTSTGDLFLDIMGADGVIAKVEKSGFMPTGVLSGVGMRGELRGLRDDNKQPIFKSSVQGKYPYELDGLNMEFVMNGSWQDEIAKLIVGDMSQAVYSIRQDVTYKLLTEAVISDPVTKEIVYNLAQQDMVALRVKMRLGWELPNGINALAPDRETRLPFAVLAPSESVGI